MMYEQFKHNVKIFLKEYFLTKGIETEPQIYENKISDDVYYNDALIVIGIIIKYCSIEIFLNSYIGIDNDITENIGVNTLVAINKDENILSMKIIVAFMKMLLKLEKTIEQAKIILLEEK